MIKTVFGIFRIKREERWLAVFAFIWMVALNVLTITKYYDKFTQIMDTYHRHFVNNFHISGFDPLTYVAVSNWDTTYNVYRHPLLAFFMYPAYLINQGLMAVTGLNCVQFVIAVILVFCAFYAFIFLYRILREVLGLDIFDAAILTIMCFSFAYVMLSAMVPDHFIISMYMLILTLYICGKMRQRRQTLSIWQTIVFFLVTAGTSLNNGIKVFMAAFFTNGKRFFHWKYLLLAVLIPCAIIWKGARMEYRHFVWPKEMARKEAKKQKDKELRAAMVQQYLDTAQVKDTTAAIAHMKVVAKKKARAKYQRDHKKVWNNNTGKPIAKGEFSRWTDISTSRWQTAVENLFGEGLILHREHFLEDVLRTRPVIVSYKLWSNYVVEGIIVLLFLLGILCGLRKRFFWTAFSFFLYDMTLHMGLGFGINEVYIMTAHWAFVIPIAIAYLIKSINWRYLPYLRCLLFIITVYLFIHNTWLLCEYMLG